jgi:hypothetical protein
MTSGMIMMLLNEMTACISPTLTPPQASASSWDASWCCAWMLMWYAPARARLTPHSHRLAPPPNLNYRPLSTGTIQTVGASLDPLTQTPLNIHDNNSHAPPHRFTSSGVRH